MNDDALVIVLFIVGVITLLGSIFDWDFYFESRKARFFVDIFGRKGARIFYGILGTALIVLGIYMKFFKK